MTARLGAALRGNRRIARYGIAWRFSAESDRSAESCPFGGTRYGVAGHGAVSRGEAWRCLVRSGIAWDRGSQSLVNSIPAMLPLFEGSNIVQRYVMILVTMVVLAGCGDSARQDIVSTVPAAVPLVPTIAPSEPAVALTTLPVADQNALRRIASGNAAANQGATLAEGLRADYTHGTETLIRVNAASEVLIQTLDESLASLKIGEDTSPLIWRCPTGLTEDALALAISSAGRVTADPSSTNDSIIFAQAIAQSRVLSQTANDATQALVHGKPPTTLSVAAIDGVRFAEQLGSMPLKSCIFP